MNSLLIAERHRFHDQAQRLLLRALAQFYVFTLVFIRLSGLMTVGPIFGQSMVPTNIRVLLILAMALLVTPTIHDHGQIIFHRLDIRRPAHRRRSPGFAQRPF